MKKITIALFTFLTIMFFSCSTQTASTETTASEETSPESTTPDEQDWVKLFDGETTAGWHNYLSDSIAGWYVKDGLLVTDGGNSDIVTDKEYENFELELEWNINAKGNSGILYYIVEDAKYPVTYATGPEYQLIDDENYPIELKPAQHTAANYDLYVPENVSPNPPGTFNTTKIVANNGKIEHWLNGELIIAYEMGSEDWKQKLQNSKFAKMEGYAKAMKGKIGLQDHGDGIAFRNIRIREL